MMGITLLGYVVYNRLDTVNQEWVDALEIWQVYLGMYVLIFASIVVIVAPILSCFAVYQELVQLLMAVSTNLVEHFNDSSVLNLYILNTIQTKSLQTISYLTWGLSSIRVHSYTVYMYLNPYFIILQKKLKYFEF